MKIFLIIILSTILYADLKPNDDDLLCKANRYRVYATKKFHRFLYYIDSSFNENEDINKSSYGKIRKSRLDMVFSLKDNSSFSLHLRGKFKLPMLKNKAELTFSQNDKEELDNQKSTSLSDDIIEDKKLHVGLKYYLYKEKRSSAYGKLSFKLNPSHFGPYLKLGVDRSYLSSSFLETSINNSLYYYINGNDLSASSSISFSRPLGEYFWVDQGNKIYWKGSSELYLKNALVLHQIFDIRNRLFYRIDYTTSYNEQEHFQHYDSALSLGYFHRFDRSFFAEIVPKIRKSRDDGYDTKYLITLNFGVSLGYKEK